MKKATTIFSMIFLGATLMAFQGKPECDSLQVEDITYIEIEEEIDLGFDTAMYLPEGFDAYTGMELNLDDIIIAQAEEVIDLGFDTTPYLPKGFNAYEGMMFEIDDIDFMEEEEEIILDFNVQHYLPTNFKVLSK